MHIRERSEKHSKTKQDWEMEIFRKVLAKGGRSKKRDDREERRIYIKAPTEEPPFFGIHNGTNTRKGQDIGISERSN